MKLTDYLGEIRAVMATFECDHMEALTIVNSYHYLFDEDSCCCCDEDEEEGK